MLSYGIRQPPEPLGARKAVRAKMTPIGTCALAIGRREQYRDNTTSSDVKQRKRIACSNQLKIVLSNCKDAINVVGIAKYNS